MRRRLALSRRRVSAVAEAAKTRTTRVGAKARHGRMRSSFFLAVRVTKRAHRSPRGAEAGARELGAVEPVHGEPSHPALRAPVHELALHRAGVFERPEEVLQILLRLPPRGLVEVGDGVD